MSYVTCAQLRYTWAERRLDGRGAGFGVVLRSHDWPPGLLEEPGLQELVTELSPAARREPAEGARARVSHLRVHGGSLLVAKRGVGTDGAGRPGNYSVHALFDPSATLGVLDLAELVAGGAFRLEREVDVVPVADADPLRVWAPPGWRLEGWRPRRPAGSGSPAFGDEPVRYRTPEELGALLLELTRRLPADLVNQLQVEALSDADRAPGGGTAVVGPGAVDELVQRCEPAAQLGAVDQDLWWERLGRDAGQWTQDLERYVLMNRPVAQVPDDGLWLRWDGASDRGRALVARELLSRPGLVEDDHHVEEAGRRRPLLDTLIDSGLQGGPEERQSAARWVAAAGDDDQVLDLAAELLRAEPDPALPAPLLARLQQRNPDELPAGMVQAVAARLDAAVPMGAVWRELCLELHLRGLPTCQHPEDLAGPATEQELVEALARASAAGSRPADCWQRLDQLVPESERAALFARADRRTAEFLLTHRLTAGEEVGTAQLVRLWPLLASTAGWAAWPRNFPLRLAAQNATLRQQRLVLLVVAAVLLVVAVVLAVLLLR